MKLSRSLAILTCFGMLLANSAGLYCADDHKSDSRSKGPYQALDAVWARRTRLAEKKMDSLVKDGVCQCERLIFHDAETGAEVWRLTFDPSMNIIHSHINRSPWNCNGSLLMFMSDRGMPGLWKRKETGRGDPHFYLMSPDGSSFRLFRPRVPEGKWGRYLTARHVNWDRFNPRRTYWVTYIGLYAADVTDEGWEVRKIIDLPNPKRRKAIFSYLSENNILMIKDLNSREYEGELYFVDLRKKPDEDWLFFHYPWRFGVKHPKHKPEAELGFHDIYFRRTPDDSYIFNFGSSGSVGEALFFEAPLHFGRDKIKICYPDAHQQIPYYSHPAWNRDGNLVSYFGVEKLPEINPGWHVRDHERRKNIARLIPGWVGGHIAWDGYDDDWVFAAVSSKRFEPQWHGWIVHAYIPDGKARKLVKHYNRLNGGKSNYAALPRPAQSPDATKCLYHSTMLHTNDATMDLYIAVSHRPAPATDVKAIADPVQANAVKVSWKPPTIHREIKGYHVYRSERPGKGFVEISRGMTTAGGLTDANLKMGKTYYYCITSEENSGLESDATSKVVELTPGKQRAEPLEPLKGWDKTPPPAPRQLKCEWFENDKALLTWTASDSLDLRYYNVYYSDHDSPEPVQRHRIVSPGSDTTSYIDWGLNREKARHFYAITAVDRQGNESKPTFARLER